MFLAISHALSSQWIYAVTEFKSKLTHEQTMTERQKRKAVGEALI